MKALALKKIISIVLLLAVIFSFTACEERITPKSRTFFGYFDTFITVYDYTGGSQRDFDAMCSEIEEKIEKYHKLFDIYNRYEGVVNLAQINESEGKLKVDTELFDFLTFALEIHGLTGGEVNIAFGSVLEIWHRYRKEGREVPSEEILNEANLHTDLKSLSLNNEEMTVERLDAQMKLDAGAVGKGYALEAVGEYIRENYGEGYVLDFGGNLKSIGTKKNGEGWTTGIKNPDVSSDSYAYTTVLSDECISTSGNYERFYTVGGVRYHHIIDKDSLFPENYYASVSVICKSGALSDALSTAFFNMTKEQILKVKSTLSNIEIIVVYENGKVEKI